MQQYVIYDVGCSISIQHFNFLPFFFTEFSSVNLELSCHALAIPLAMINH